jgi:hypothetical protein
MLFLIVVYIWDLLIIITTVVAGQQQLHSQTFDITIGKKYLLIDKTYLIDLLFFFCRWCFYR